MNANHTRSGRKIDANIRAVTAGNRDCTAALTKPPRKRNRRGVGHEVPANTSRLDVATAKQEIVQSLPMNPLVHFSMKINPVFFLFVLYFQR